jgi:plasmid maintenance system antidote protein VapI
MKSYKDLSQKYDEKEIAESFVFPGSKNEKQRQSQLEAFREYRQKIDNSSTQEDRLRILLLQLKFQIEDYIGSKDFSKTQTFSFFLKEYILRLDKKNKEFAEEIDIDPTELSQIINHHRYPSQKLIIRLEIHSNKNFPALMWFKLIEKEKAYEIAHDKNIRAQESKHVKQKLEFSLL